MAKKKGTYYAVAVGRKPGIYRTWAEAEQQTKGFPAAQHEKFLTKAEASEYMAKYQGDTSLEEVTQDPHDSNILALLGSMSIGKPVQDDQPWRENLRDLHGNMLVAFCAGSAPRNGREYCTAAYATSFSLENVRTQVTAVTDTPTNNRADCLAAKAATAIADELDPERYRSLVIYTRYEGLVSAMGSDNGKPGWVYRWAKNGWKTTSNEPVVNQDIYKRLLGAANKRVISWRFLDTKVEPAWLVNLHQQTHDEALSVASAAARTASGA